jgi:replicative DNA helicase
MSSGTTYDFGDDFQTLILGYMFRDMSFNVRTDGLIKPQYFTSEVFAALAGLAAQHFKTYRSIPSRAGLQVMLKDAFDTKRIRPELKAEVISVIKAAYGEDLIDVDFAVDHVTKFARKQELSNAILKCAELIDKGDYDPVEPIMAKANMVGQNEDHDAVDFWDEADNRLKQRQAIIAGTIRPTGVTTGFEPIDKVLYHEGWGRKELTVLMGPAKSGKSMTLVTFAMKAALAGKNVLFVSLEVAKTIIADRLEANLSGVPLNDLATQMKKARDETVLAASRGAGILKVHDFPSGTFTGNQLRRMLHRYRSLGINFDMVVVDYADLMAPNHHSDEARENSRTIYIDLRAIAYEFDCAVLSATQTNRAGFKAAVGDMEHVADDINKVRTVDLLISLNRDEEEKAKGHARLYLAASRNQASANIIVKCDLSKARYIESVIKVET